jgi:hypothetical protein
MKIRGVSTMVGAMATWVSVALLFSGAAAPAGAGGCVSADVPAPVALPDGTIHEPGTLSVCIRLSISPVSTLHTAQLDGHPAGFMLSRRGVAEGMLRTPSMLFLRQVDGSLMLRGYAVPEGDRTVTYLIEPARRGSRHARARRPADRGADDGVIVALGLATP